MSRQPKEPANAPRYAFSTLDIVAPDGRYGWLNDWAYGGTLHSLRQQPNVLIRVDKVRQHRAISAIRPRACRAATARAGAC